MNLAITIMSAIFGALLGGLVRAYLDRSALVTEREGMAAAIGAEVEALVALIERRDFVGSLQRGIARLEDEKADVGLGDIFQIQARRDYFVVFRNLSLRLGVLGPLSRQIVLFYSLATALVDEMDAVRAQCEAIAAGTRPFRREEALEWNREILKVLLLANAEAAPLLRTLWRAGRIEPHKPLDGSM